MIDFIQNSAQDSIDVGLSDTQHIEDLIVLCKGWHKFYPFIGACAHTHLHNEFSHLEMKQNIFQELENDGMRVNRVRLSSRGTIDLQAEYDE
ncbi:MAG: hypothetical protein OXB93_03390 [Cytophagales bacterium]|nr:hypothetical protein [Cytophagales bacterium]